MDLKPLFHEIRNLKEKTDQIFIYGFGSYGRNLLQILKKYEIEVDGFIVSNNQGDEVLEEIPIYQASDFFDKNVGYVLALNAKNSEEVKKYLKDNNIESQYIINAGEYLEQFGEKRGTNVGSIEITPIIGCKVNCLHCPQNLLLTQYFKEDKNRTKIMSIETFEKCLCFFPESYDISFGGMAEPFLNDNFVEMLKIACKKNRNVSLYTTLVGAEQKNIDEIIKLPLKFVVLHVADKYGYANIPLTDEYYTNIEKVINARKVDGTGFINMCNAQAEPDERVKEICDGKYEIFTKMTDRAGNLKNKSLIHKNMQKGKIRCGNLGVQMNNNILLPDGSVVLCCMDYGLKHILGNIHKNTFEEIMRGDEMARIKKGMAGETAIDILCRTCSYARRINS